MKYIIYTLLTIALLLSQDKNIIFDVNLNDRADDQFKVTLTVEGLKKENKIYQFASTAPGTYQTMDIGRYVRSFKAFDKNGKEISTTSLSTNQYAISDPENVRRIEYSIAETWDTPVDFNKIYLMCGTSIEKDHVFINGQAVFGYFHGLQAEPFKVKLRYPDTWKVGTALNMSNGYYLAEDYDHAVDSPILMGRLSYASLKVQDTDVEVYTYSKTDVIKSEMILEILKDMLNSVAEFTNGLPVERYAFLFHFEDQTNGAWEHSYSSAYVYQEVPFQLIKDQLRGTASHEFFHIVTPLNIHSEKVEQFNFVKPTPSKHLWLYEGTTEWASEILLMRNNVKTVDAYFADLSNKVATDEYFSNQFGENKFSLIDLSLNSFGQAGQAQYANIYFHGALVAGLLDIKLLELSDGKRGYREVINELTKKYGKSRPFNDDTFIDDFIEFTYPELRSFFDDYIINKKSLPLKEYYEKIGVAYFPQHNTGKKIVSLGISGAPKDGRILVQNVSDEMKAFGMEQGDIILKYNGEDVFLNNAQTVLQQIQSSPVGQEFEFIVKRGSDEVSVKGKLIGIDEVKKHYFTFDENASSKAKKLREIWLKNL